MGVYIKNVDMPTDCGHCDFFKDYKGECYCYITDHHITFIGEIADDCPLIEIDLERDIPTIWYNRQTGQYEPKDTKQEVYERLYKLKNGERRE